MFRDEARIFVFAGKGGDGCLSFRRERSIAKGGPDGGNGGRGGHVVLVADDQVSSLLKLVRNPHRRAGNGQAGSGNVRTGRTGRDLRVPVPAGTIVRDQDSGLVLKDLTESGDEVIVAQGGKPGRGNSSFKSALNQTPHEVQEGEAGQERTLLLELKLIADIGLLGLPNAGKSTLISRLSAARPKIADYPFTTLDPHPGLVELSGFRRLVVMDIPGLIAGAHQGQGLGTRFLRHVERTRGLVQLIDLSPSPGEVGPEQAFQTILQEIEAFGHDLLKRPRLCVFSKADLVPAADQKAAELSERLGIEAYPVSAVSGLNLERLVEDCWGLIHPAGPDPA